ncbi:MAG: heme ABC exporter ATP-binding protein CcmA [Sphingobium sp.]
MECRRGGRLLFSGLDFSLEAGESLLLRGPNGIGKSSLLRLIAGLIPGNNDAIQHGGETMALADENLALDPDRTLYDALAFWAHLDGRGMDDIAAGLAHYDLSALAGVPVRILSTGQRKRAILARTMASGASLWLLDEPGNGLDSASLERLGAAMNAHIANGGAIIAASHFALPHDFTWVIDLSKAAA